MATDGPTPPPCNPDIFNKGETVAALSGSSNAIERWVQSVAKKAKASMDWHYSGGVAQVLHLGDQESRARVHAAMDQLKHNLEGTVIKIYVPGEKGLYRQGVTQVPPGTVATSMDPLTGDAEYMVDPTKKK